GRARAAHFLRECGWDVALAEPPPAPVPDRVQQGQPHQRQLPDGPGIPVPMSSYAERRGQLVAAFGARRPGSVGIAKDTSNLFRDRAPAGKHLLDVRAFDHVLAVDPSGQWVEAEGMAPFEEIVASTLAAGVMPAVVPQLKTITLGGAAAGVGIEASSFRHGLVHESLLEMDVLTGRREVVTCRPDNEHADLFFGFPNSYGTLGYALKLRAKTV